MIKNIQTNVKTSAEIFCAFHLKAPVEYLTFHISRKSLSLVEI